MDDLCNFLNNWKDTDCFLSSFPNRLWKGTEMNEVSVIACSGCSWQHFTLFWSPALVWCQTPLATGILPRTWGLRTGGSPGVMQWPVASLPSSPPLSRPHLSKLQTVQRAVEQTSHYAIITSTTLNTLSTLIIGLHLECQVLFFKSDGCLPFNRDWSANDQAIIKLVW